MRKASHNTRRRDRKSSHLDNSIDVKEIASRSKVSVGIVHHYISQKSIPFQYGFRKKLIIERSTGEVLIEFLIKTHKNYEKKEKRSVLWTPEEDARIREYYPHFFTEEASLLFPNKNLLQLNHRAYTLGLKRLKRKVYFPREFSSDVDGNYVSGLVDGEGWFMVSLARKGKDKTITNFNPKFGINLRIDDKPILDWMRSYFDCGTVVTYTRPTSPCAIFMVADLYSILRCIVPHFEKYPLRAKKKRDYEIWRQMVNIQSETFRGYWTNSIRAEMGKLYSQLREGRKLVTDV